MTTFFSSDWHLSHQRIIELCDRPFGSVDEMNKEIIENCNDVVTESDQLCLLGDTIMGPFAETVLLLRKLRCRKILLYPGNHDRFSRAYHHKGDASLQRERFRRIYAEQGVVTIRDASPSQWFIDLDGTRFSMSHYPYEGDSHDEDRYPELRPVDDGLPLLHGHVHTEWQTRDRMMNVGVDVWDFAPVSEERVLEWADTL